MHLRQIQDYRFGKNLSDRKKEKNNDSTWPATATASITVYEFGSPGGPLVVCFKIRDKHSGMVPFRGISRGTLQEMALDFTVTHSAVYSK